MAWMDPAKLGSVEPASRIKEASPELVAGQGHILTQAIYVSKSKDRLVENLIEVDPA